MEVDQGSAPPDGGRDRKARVRAVVETVDVLFGEGEARNRAYDADLGAWEVS